MRIVVVSNRLPWTLKRSGSNWRTERSPGGLATAMTPILKRTGGIWIGWSGEASGSVDEKRRKILQRWAEEDGYYAVDFPPEVARGFYEGHANQTLWPVFHYFTSFVDFTPEDWQAYVDANLRLRDVVLEHLRPGDIVWVHDYQLMLLPGLLREVAPSVAIGFFLHIPFPSSAVLRILPGRKELLLGLLGSDYIGFHTYNYLQHFRSSVLRILGYSGSMDRIDLGNRSVRIDALPMGIDPQEFSNLLDRDEKTQHRVAELRQRFAGRRLLLAVDRLDYTKGIPKRLRAYHRLFRRSPGMRGRTVLVQVAVPSRERIPMYRELAREVDELVGKINGEFSEPDWTPVVYIRRGIPRPELAALYAAADVALVTPLRDGLNLVAKEYVACQRGGDGVIVLSEFAGAASEMGEAFFVNPFDEEGTSEIIEQALSIGTEERRERMTALYNRVVRNNVFAWSERFLSNLCSAAASRRERPSGEPQELPRELVLDAFRAAKRRLLLLDYDGTLVSFATRPQDAVPPRSLIEILTGLVRAPETAVAIISGRSRKDVDAWFGGIPGLWLAAEHGAMVRSPERKEWEMARSHYAEPWKQQVHPLLESFVDRTPGSFIEEKELSLVWHYRMSDSEFGDWLANELVSTLDQMLADTDLRAVRGNKAVEVKPIWANKGEVLEQLLRAFHNPAFLLAAGDDLTDEDLFAQLAEHAWSIHIGESRSRARFRVSHPDEMLGLLAGFMNPAEEESSANPPALEKSAKSPDRPPQDIA